MGLLLLIIVIFFVLQFLYSKHQQSVKVAEQGGMGIKYRLLIGAIISWDPQNRITVARSDYLVINIASKLGLTDILIVQNNSNLTVKWMVERSVLDKPKLKWEFYEFGNQRDMANRIKNDIEQFAKNVKTATDPRSQFINDFQNEFTKEQKAIIMSYLIAITYSDGNFLPQKQKEIESAAKLIGIKTDDPVFDSMPQGIFEENSDYYIKILNTLDRNQKEWFTVMACEMIAFGGNENIDIRYDCVLKVMGNVGISEDDFVQIIQKTMAIYEKLHQEK